MSNHSHHSRNSHDNSHDRVEFQSNTHVRVGKFPGKLQEIEILDKPVVADILATAELSPDGYDLRLNGFPVSIQDRVEPGDTVYLVKPIKGN